mmetsp:Transcript_81402/g.264256  ORF Transcript_81402/g.264256 Transcript_81402/m.264256 type:complete len:208 (+) Transcript_81402:2324-2947(+)
MSQAEHGQYRQSPPMVCFCQEPCLQAAASTARPKSTSPNRWPSVLEPSSMRMLLKLASRCTTCSDTWWSTSASCITMSVTSTLAPTSADWREAPSWIGAGWHISRYLSNEMPGIRDITKRIAHSSGPTCCMPVAIRAGILSAHCWPSARPVEPSRCKRRRSDSIDSRDVRDLQVISLTATGRPVSSCSPAQTKPKVPCPSLRLTLYA